MKKVIIQLLFIFSFIQITQAQNYSEIIKATASDATLSDHFGISVSISGDYAIVGANLNDDDGSSSGAVYIFKKDQGGADNWGELKKLTASDAAADDEFGWSVSISGDYAIVGANLDDDNGSSSGSAYIFKKDQGGADNWGELKKLTASDAAASDFFGWSVSISGDYAIVGANLDDDDGSSSGSVYIFKKDQGGADNWGELKKLTASDAATGDNFGYNVSISGDYAIVSAYSSASFSGAAYIYKKDQGGADNWGELKKLTASDAATSDNFGQCVSISGDYTIVGADGNDDDGSSSGSAYIYKKDQGGADNWGELKKLTASDAAAYDFFGINVSISGDYVIIGADGNDDDGNSSGSAYIYKKDEGGTDNWGEVKKITASDADAAASFGYKVGISGDYAIVGAYRDDNNGSSYIYKNLGVLPVELTYFNGKKGTEGNELTWQTASEKINKGFEVQRSSNGEEWEVLDFVEGQGTITTTQNYTYLDKNPAKGNNYYRLKQMDYDEQFEYSHIVNITIEQYNNSTISIFPNPVQDELNIIGGQGQITIYNLLGQPVKQFTINTEQSTINLTDLPSGQYILHIQSREIGRTIATQRFLK